MHPTSSLGTGGDSTMVDRQGTRRSTLFSRTGSSSMTTRLGFVHALGESVRLKNLSSSGLLPPNSARCSSRRSVDDSSGVRDPVSVRVPRRGGRESAEHRGAPPAHQLGALDLCDVTVKLREQLESRRRSDPRPLVHPAPGRLVLRNQIHSQTRSSRGAGGRGAGVVARLLSGRMFPLTLAASSLDAHALAAAVRDVLLPLGRALSLSRSVWVSPSRAVYRP